MKKYLVAMTMMMTLGMGLTATAQGHQTKDEQELVDPKHQNDQLEAYSDTTGSRT